MCLLCYRNLKGIGVRGLNESPFSIASSMHAHTINNVSMSGRTYCEKFQPRSIKAYEA